jgi:RNA polymerase sigma-70 factor (ECF subfamily)
MDVPSAELLVRWRQGDQEAAEELFHRYAERLYALARSRLAAWLTRHVDPEDVVQSAYRSFFDGARGGRFALQRSGDLWRLLAAITLHKLKHQVERHTAEKRSVARECRFPLHGTFGLPAHLLSREPTPSEATALADTVERVLRGLEPLQRRMVELRLQGCSLDEIAADVQRSERTVRRVLDQVKERLQQESTACKAEPGPARRAGT